MKTSSFSSYHKTMISFVFLFALSSISFLGLTQSTNDQITQTCKRTPNPTLCESTLRSDPRSSSHANLETLTLITVDAVNAKAKQTLRQVNKLLKSFEKPEQRRILTFCANNYKALIKADVPEAIEGITKGDYKFAEQGMNDAANEAEFCENEFLAGKSPLTDLNTSVRDVATVASSMVRMLMVG